MSKKMNFSISQADLSRYTARQIDHLFNDGEKIQPEAVDSYMKETLGRIENCFRNIQKKYFQEGGAPTFNHLHSDHYAMFLYVLGNTMYRKSGDTPLAAKVFLLNKALHAIDAYYSVELPETFQFVHPVGTVLGRAQYGDYFTVYQNCAVGAEGTDYPVIGKGVVLYSRCSVLGKSKIGNNVVLGANSFILNADIPDDSVVVGTYPNLRILKNRKKPVIERLFR